MIDGRNQNTSFLSTELIHRLCDRRFGIGSDGMILLENSKRTDFRMRYYNADGREGSMCGNGGRCITAFAHHLGIIGTEAHFEGIDGDHRASLLTNGDIRLKLKDVNGITPLEDGYLLDTGSPHFVTFVEKLSGLEVPLKGREIRHQARFSPGGVNANFVELGKHPEQIAVRTYERGVEAETYSCGTGVTAAAICSYIHLKTDIISYDVQTPGGMLHVSFQVQNRNHYSEIYLSGPAVHVFSGSITLKP